MVDVSKINPSRLRINYNNMLECHKEIRYAIEDYDSVVNDRWRLHAEKSLRSSISEYRQMVFNCVSHFNKCIGVSVSSEESETLFNNCVSLGYFDSKVSKEFIRTLVRYRNISSHQYKRPSVSDLFKFVDNFEKEMLLLEESVLKVINLRLNSVNNLDNSSLF